MDVLGIPVGQPLLAKWCGWLMPLEQPFLVPRTITGNLGLIDDRDRLKPESRDSFMLYRLQSDQAVCWLNQQESRRLPVAVRRSQPAAHRWPRDGDDGIARVVRYVEHRRRPSRHREVAELTWRRVADYLPAARALAGTFPAMSGPNCFGTVMGAAGVRGAADTWLLREPFEEWLAATTQDGGSDQDIGTVLVWRGDNGSVQHSAVTLGDGWALHKPSQGWMAPIKVLPVRDAKLSSRSPGIHLQRRRINS
jgi:hypothetical protein